MTSILIAAGVFVAAWMVLTLIDIAVISIAQRTNRKREK